MPHNPFWKKDFEVEKKRILSVAEDSVKHIEHIGSTAIPTVHAKPILDIAILCGEQDLEPVVIALESLGYEYRGQFDDEKTGHFYSVLDKDNIRLCQVHIYTKTNADWHSKLKFRDVLTNNVELAREYSDYKRQLVKVVSNKSEYAEIKDKWFNSFILKVL